MYTRGEKQTVGRYYSAEKKVPNKQIPAGELSS